MSQEAEITGEELPRLLDRNQLVVVHYWAEWNGIDDKVKAVLEQILSGELRNSFVVARIDIDNPTNRSHCQEHKVLTVPYFEFYEKGLLVRTQIGWDSLSFVRVISELVFGPRFQD